MAQEPSYDFLKSISKFKKNFSIKKSSLFNQKTRIEMINDFIITKNKMSDYESMLVSVNIDKNKAKQIKNKIEKYNLFLSTLPQEICIPLNLYKTFNHEIGKLYVYFILFRRKNRIISETSFKNSNKNFTEEELEIARLLIDNFYNINNVIIKDNKAIIQLSN